MVSSEFETNARISREIDKYKIIKNYENLIWKYLK